jgi:hypothetical protein
MIPAFQHSKSCKSRPILFILSKVPGCSSVVKNPELPCRGTSGFSTADVADGRRWSRLENRPSSFALFARNGSRSESELFEIFNFHTAEMRLRPAASHIESSSAPLRLCGKTRLF